MFHHKPIIGLAGGIGSGKSYVARILGEMGCFVIDSDALVSEIYREPAVREMLRNWWGDQVIAADGSLDRRAVGRRVFNSAADKARLESFVHPLVDRRRQERMTQAIAQTPDLKAFIWDTPLLFETGHNTQCDAIIFIDAPLAERLQRIASRGWSGEELTRRENLQWPLDKKRSLCNDVIVNSASGAADQQPAVAEDTRGQIGSVLSRILARLSNSPA